MLALQLNQVEVENGAKAKRDDGKNKDKKMRRHDGGRERRRMSRRVVPSVQFKNAYLCRVDISHTFDREPERIPLNQPRLRG